MVAFYRALGFDVAEHPHVVSVYVGDQMINFHRPATWQRDELHAAGAERAAAVRRSLLRLGRHAGRRCDARLDGAGAADRGRARWRGEGGRRADATSVYVRDPDGNLLEFMIYP